MKKLMMMGSALLVLSSTSAYATQARLLALGMNETDNEGMYHISDSRNIFLNPAYINVYSDQAVFEWGNVGTKAAVTGSPTSAATLNTSTEPKAQGGVFKKYGDFVYGLYFGNESNTSSLLRVAGTSAASALHFSGAATPASKMLQSADNQVDIFFGGDNGMKWAANATVGTGKDETRNGKDSALAIRGGLIGSNWDAHLNLSLASKAEANEAVDPLAAGALAATVRQEFEGKLGVHIGGSYVFEGSNRVFGYVKHYGWEQTDSYNNYTALSAASTGGIGQASGGQNGMVKGDFTSFHLGWGRDFDVNTGDKLFTSLTAKQTNINLKFASKSEIRHLMIPVTIGYEAKATEWLVLRGSVVQNLYGKQDNKGAGNLNVVARNLITGIYGGNGKKTLANSTNVNAGATLTFGQLSVDGLIGTTSTAGVDSRTSTGPGTGKGLLSLRNLETSVAATYKF